MRRLIGSGAGGLAVLVAIAALMPGARAATVTAPPVTSDRGLQLQMQHLLASANPLVNRAKPSPSHPTTGVPPGALRALAHHAPLTCFVDSGACPLTPCVVPVTAGQLIAPAASGGSCPARARRAEPDKPVSLQLVRPLDGHALGTGILDPSGGRIYASP